jgi:hypothetical protein
MAKRPFLFVISIVLSFIAGIALGGFGPRVLRRLAGRSHPQELARVTSPKEQLDAVMILEQYGGAVGGNDWYVYIVDKGKPVPSGLDAIFSASELDREKLVWKQPRLLEIQYDVGEIYGFRNLWCSNRIRNAPDRERDYCVEIRLAPSSPNSILDLGGNFRSLQAD